MQASRPRYLLIAEVEQAEARRLWRFVLHASDASVSVAACDAEQGADEERLALLAVVRGLEALDQPAQVTVVTRSPRVLGGLTEDLDVWRNNHWREDRFGRPTPIRDADLWRRIAKALEFHAVDCHSWRTEEATESTASRQPLADRPRSSRVSTWFEGRGDSPAMVIVRSPRSRRRVRLSEPAAIAC